MSNFPIQIPNSAIPKKFPTIKIDNEDEIRKRNKEKLVFSFDYFDRVTQYFTCSEAEHSWFIALLDVLQNISKLNWIQFSNDNYTVYEPHPIDWDTYDTTCKFPFNNIDQYDPFQFRISHSKGRIAGFLIGNIFYIVWLDHKHFLYSSEKKKGGKNKKGFEKPYKMAPSKTCYDLKNEECESLKNKISKLENYIQELEELKLA